MRVSCRVCSSSCDAAGWCAKGQREAKKRAERPKVPSMLPATPNTTLRPDLGVVDLLDFVIDLLTATRK